MSELFDMPEGLKKICIFAGTTEGRELAALLRGQPLAITICVATEYAESFLRDMPEMKILTGRLDETGMENLFRQGTFDCVVDATHPYAVEVTENVARACQKTNTTYLRLLRVAETAGGVVSAPDVPTAAAYLAEHEGNILFTTGSKDLSAFAQGIPDFSQRAYARVLPMESSLQACGAAGLDPSHILAMQGPFSQEMNIATLRTVKARFLVTKDTGVAGGFPEKAAAARTAGAEMVVIGRPTQREGRSFAGVVEWLCKNFGLTIKPAVALIGVGPGVRAGMTAEALAALDRADCVIGAARMLETATRPGQRRRQAIAPLDIATMIHEESCHRFAVLFSGDTGFYSGAKKLLPFLEGCQVKIFPGLSSLSLLCARLGTSYEDVVTASLHGRDGSIVPEVRHNKRVFVLVGGENDAANLCQSLADADLAEVSIAVGERLGYPDEKITRGMAAELAGNTFASLSAVLVENPNATPFVPGLPDRAFERGRMAKKPVPMTKSEVRAVAMSLLRPAEDAVCWDVGAGTGSVSVELGLLARRGKVYAIEQREEAVELLQTNKARFGLDNLEIISGSAPDVCKDLPAPDCAYIGGSSGNLKDILTLLREKNPAVRIVASAVTLETQAELTACMRDFPTASAVCLSVTRGKRAGRLHLTTAQNPVWLYMLQWA